MAAVVRRTALRAGALGESPSRQRIWSAGVAERLRRRTRDPMGATPPGFESQPRRGRRAGQRHGGWGTSAPRTFFLLYDLLSRASRACAVTILGITPRERPPGLFGTLGSRVRLGVWLFQPCTSGAPSTQSSRRCLPRTSWEPRGMTRRGLPPLF